MTKTLIALSLLLMLNGCSAPEQTPKPKVPTTVEVPIPVTDLRLGLQEIVDKSSCTTYRWKNRSVAPKAYTNGMALMYAKQVCGQGSDFIKPDKVKGTWYYDGKHREHDDALDFYKITGNQLNTYTLLIGLGMRESSGRYGAGRDLSQDFTKSGTAEAGLFQMSYNAKLYHKELNPLYLDFKNGVRDCELKAFKDSRSSKVKSHEGKHYGSGEGAAWQEVMKKCPAASVAWAAILVRARMAHFGPLKRKEAEFRKECQSMLEKVEVLAKKHCGQLE